jgi:hypothetical protein
MFAADAAAGTIRDPSTSTAGVHLRIREAVAVFMKKEPLDTRAGPLFQVTLS